MPRQKDRKKLLPQRDRSFICGGKWGASDGSLYFAGTQAAGAGVDTAGSTVYNCLYSSDIGLPGTVRTAMGETLIPKVTPLPQISHFAICLHLLIGQYNHATLVSYQSLRPKARTFLLPGGFWQEFCCFFPMIKYILYNTMR